MRHVRLITKPCITQAMFVLCLGSFWGVSLGAPGDLVLPRKSDETNLEAVPASRFPHWVHRIQYRCDACHNRLFKMELGASEITMEAMSEGKSCGTCHNGERAFEVGFATCNRCHAVAEE